ncbi:unnamed protein product, partial [Didymodactylos carnosus]
MRCKFRVGETSDYTTPYTINSQSQKRSLENNAKAIVRYMKSEWHLPTPDLIISIPGDGNLLEMKRRLRNEFQHRLILTALRTDAWIITDGIMNGVMEEVTSDINILPFDNVYEDSSRLYRIRKPSQMEKSKRKYPLDPNHTHFILLEDEYGSENVWGKRNFPETKHDLTVIRRNYTLTLRDEIEKQARKLDEHAYPDKNGNKCESGDESTFSTVTKAIDNGTPVVVIRNTGGLADEIADKYKPPENSATDKSSTSESQKRSPQSDQTLFLNDENKQTLEMIIKSPKASYLITILEYKDKEIPLNLDATIFLAYLQVHVTMLAQTALQ